MYNTKNLHTTHTCIYVGEKKCIYNDKTIMLINKTWQQQEDDQMLPSTLLTKSPETQSNVKPGYRG